jgi:hypothetical protein
MKMNKTKNLVKPTVSYNTICLQYHLYNPIVSLKGLGLFLDSCVITEEFFEKIEKIDFMKDFMPWT